MVAAAENFLHGTQRIVSVKLYVSEIVFVDDKIAHQMWYKRCRIRKIGSTGDATGAFFLTVKFRLAGMACPRIGCGCFISPMASSKQGYCVPARRAPHHCVIHTNGM